MKVQKITSEVNYSLITVEEHLDFLRSKFKIKLSKDAQAGFTETEALLNSMSTVVARKLGDISRSSRDIEVIQEQLPELIMMSRHFTNYLELIKMDIEDYIEGIELSAAEKHDDDVEAI